MGILYIREYTDAAVEAGNGVPVMCEPGTDQSPITYSTTTQSAAFGTNTKFVRVHTDSICSIVFGANPTATTNAARMTAGSTEYFSVIAGQKVAAITNT